MRILVLIPVYKRPEVLKETIKQWTQPDIIPLFILSPEDDCYKENKEIIKGFNYIIYKNLPLGEKMNVGIYNSLQIKYDYLMNIGSDDILEDRYYNKIKEYLGKEKLIGYHSCIAQDFKSGKKYLINGAIENMPIGAGRLIHRSIIEKIVIQENHRLYTDTINRGLDTDSFRTIYQNVKDKFVIIQDDNPPIIDLKTETNINTLHFLKKHLIEL